MRFGQHCCCIDPDYRLGIDHGLARDCSGCSHLSTQRAVNGFVQPDRRVGRMINLNQAVRIVREESGGKVLSAKSVRSPNGSLRHHVRVLVDGQRVTTLVVDQQGRLQRTR